MQVFVANRRSEDDFAIVLTKTEADILRAILIHDVIGEMGHGGVGLASALNEGLEKSAPYFGSPEITTEMVAEFAADLLEDICDEYFDREAEAARALMREMLEVAQ